MPRFQVRAAGSASLAPLVDGDEQIVVQLEERNHPLAFAVRTVDVATHPPNRRPASAKAACPFGKVSVFRDTALHDPLNGIIHPVEVTGRQLRMRCAGVKQSRRGRTKPAAFV